MHSVATSSEGVDAPDNLTDTAMSSPESETFEDVLSVPAVRTTAPLTQDTAPSGSAVRTPDDDDDMSMDSPQPEGFTIRLPTPPVSSIAPSVYEPPTHAPPLPRPRRNPLPPGGPKEASLLFYVDNALENIGKRVTNKHVTTLYPGELEGYKSFAEFVKDLDGLVDVVWVSGTRECTFLSSMYTGIESQSN